MKFLAATLVLAGTAGTLWAQGELTVPSATPASAILPSKKIRPNDLVSVSVFGEPEFTRSVRVDPEGLIRLALLKDKIKADGLMPEQLENAIGEALKREQILVNPDVTVTVAEYYRPLRLPISVAGAVRTPITFQPVEPVTLLEAITRAGGVTAEAGPEILITPARQVDAAGGALPDAKTGPVTHVRVKSLVDAADASGNAILTGGEEIRVPEAGHIYVFGNVKKPGTLPAEDSQDATVFKAIGLSEGLAQYAAKQAYIFRREAGSTSRKEIPIDLRRIVDHKAPDVPLMANDILYVPDNTGRRNTISTLKVIGALGVVVLSAMIYVALR